GITEDQYDKIYNMFYRGSDRSKGNGLGLYLVKASVDKLRGKIKIDSEESVYTQFVIIIPL
ncbi:MAG: ATP-binding protein, partial [Bacteroidota bacterium]